MGASSPILLLDGATRGVAQVGSDASRTKGPRSAAYTEARGPWGVGGLDSASWGWQSRGRGGVTSSLLQALVAAQTGHAQSPT